MSDQEFYQLSIEKQYQYLQEAYPEAQVDWKYKHNVTICERSKTVVEPLISQEFFVDYYREFYHNPVTPPKVQAVIKESFDPFKYKELQNILTVDHDFQIEGERVKLVFYNQSHAQFLAAEMTSPIADMLISPLFATQGEAWQWIQLRHGENLAGNRLELAILSQRDGQYLGGCGVRQENGVYKLSIWIKESAQGQNYAKESIEVLIDWIWNNIDTLEITWECKINNPKSIELARSLNFEYINDQMYSNGLWNETRFSVFKLFKPLPIILKSDIPYRYFDQKNLTQSDTTILGNRSQSNEPHEERRPRSVAIIRIKGTDRIICSQGSMSSNWEGYRDDKLFYFFSGGKIELGESPIEAAIRETEEEFGLTNLQHITLLGVAENYGLKWKDSITHGIEYYYLFEITQEDIENRQKAELDLNGLKLVEATVEDLKTNNWPQLNWILDQPAILKSFSKTTLQQLTLDGIGETNFYPIEYQERGAKYFQSIRNWCISRDLIWGHKMPVWYNLSGNKRRRFFSYQQWLENDVIETSSDDFEDASKYVPSQLLRVQDIFEINPNKPTKPGNWAQEVKILDTWFSSTLWPLTTLNFEQFSKTGNMQGDFAQYYPTQLMTTAWEIFYAWVLRMIMNGKYFTGTSPFQDYMCHAWVLDEKGRKMSKSLGNTIDPVTEINTYSADAVRMTMLSQSIPGRNMKYKRDLPEKYRNFGNKLWNVARFFEFQEIRGNEQK